jgi:hypothetical protein
MAKYNKFWVAIVGLVGTLLVHFLGADSDQAFVWDTIVVAVAAAGVFAVPNSPAPPV